MALQIWIMVFLELIIFLIAFAFVASFIIVITVKKRIKLLNETAYQKIDSKRVQLNEEIETIRKSNVTNEQILDFIDSFARSILNERFKISNDLGYSEIKAIFDKANNTTPSLFCKKMIEARYSGNTLTKTRLIELIHLIYDILKEYEQATSMEIEETIKNMRFGSVYLTINKIRNWEIKMPFFAQKEKSISEDKTLITLPDLPQFRRGKIKITEIKQPSQQLPVHPFQQIQNKGEMKEEKKMRHLDNKMIESVDILDRIKNKITRIKERKGISSWPTSIR